MVRFDLEGWLHLVWVRVEELDDHWLEDAVILEGDMGKKAGSDTMGFIDYEEENVLSECQNVARNVEPC